MHISRTPTILMSALALVASGLVAAGCSGGGSGSDGSGTTTTTGETGQVTVAVTDAASDEIDTFEVDIVSFRFEKANGATVEILPQKARVDFAQLVTVSEVIAAATLPVGSYTKAFMTLDFSSASVRISGNTSAAALVDGQGRALSGQEELEIVFPNGGFTVGARRGYFAEVDFDLDQSLTVDAAANRVEVDTVLYATIDPAQPKQARVPGLTSNFSTSSFDLDVRIGLGLISRGTLTVNTTSSTVYNLQGQVLTGQAGFDALEALGDRTLIVAAGVVDPQAKTLAAQMVFLLPQDLDEVGGLVVGRSAGPGQDTVLTLRGVSVRRAAGAVTFNDLVTINCSLAETKVNKRGVAAGTLDTDAINVGQRILAYGRFSGTSLDLTQQGAGFIRMVETNISGAAAAPPSGNTLEVDTVRIGHRPIQAFDFTVGGVTQADPDQLSCDTGGMSLATISSGSPVVVLGHFAPVTSTTSTAPSFQADTVIDRSNTGSLLRVVWLPASTAAISTSTGSSELTLDITGTIFKQIDWGLVAPVTLTQNPTVSGQGGFFAVRDGFRLTLFTSFSSFKTHLETQLAGGSRVLAFRALGKWDTNTNRLTAARAVVTLR